MCRVEDADRAVIETTEERRARTVHKCTECHRIINRGERYEYSHALHGGRWDTYRTCAHCCAARLWLERECHGYVYTEVLEELVEHWWDGYQNMWLARVIAGMRHRWHDGRLPVPSEPPALVVA